jgi:thioredoxin reductase (NADPH)
MQAVSAPSLIERRREQLFPVLSPAQIAVARRFGGLPVIFGREAIVFEIGQADTPAYLVLAGSIVAARRDPLGDDPLGDLSVVTTHAAGELTGEIGQLSGGPSLARGRSGVDGAEVVPFNSTQLRALIVATVEIGEMIMRAFILRRVLLIETGAGLVLLGSRVSADAVRLENFLRRNAVPYTMLDPDSDRDAVHLIERMAISKAELPLAICPDGTVLRRPRERVLAQCLGLLPSFLDDRAYDVAVVGAGPAGLATAVYAASEGLSVLVLDARAFGGQAGASARIENYLGFPTGISGQALAGRAFAQAEKFGAVMAIPAEVRLLKAVHARDTRSDAPGFELELNEGHPVRATTVVIASGARYRKPALPNLTSFEGRGVYYWASSIELKLCTRREVVVVGGGNSAGQGTVFLASDVARVHLLVRGRSLEEGMSQYLIDRIGALPNVEVHTETELTQLIGDPNDGLQAVCWRSGATGMEERHAVRHVFLFIGAEPNTDWLRLCDVKVDDKRFVRTGDLHGCPDGYGDEPPRQALPLETSLPGVFAVGDVRVGSAKRVASAVGDGAAAAAQLHLYLRTSQIDQSKPEGKS